MQQPMPFNRRAFLKSTLASNVAEIKRALQAKPDTPLMTTPGSGPRPAAEGPLIKAAVDKQTAAGKRSTL